MQNYQIIQQQITISYVGRGFTEEELKNREERNQQMIIKRKNLEYILAYSNATPFIWNKSKYSCFFCKKQIQDPDSLREHTSSKHRSDNLELVIFDRTTKFTRDSAVKIDVKDLTCKLCFKKAYDVEAFINHIIVAHDADYDVNVQNCILPFILDKVQPTCATCNTKFIFFEYLLRHANKLHLSHNYMCDICGTSFQGENHLRMHNRYYHKVGGYDCEYCHVSLTTLSKKLLHEKHVHELRLLTCPHCPQTFKSSYLKKQHLARIHKVAELDIKCPYCPKSFPQESLMSRHMRRVHLKEKNVKCDICDDKFFNSYDLKMHMIKHNGQKTHVCKVCNKKFAKKSNLKTHQIVHSGKKDYLCEVCHKSFALLGNLKVHIKYMHPRAATLMFEDTSVTEKNEETQVCENEIDTVEYLEENQDMVDIEDAQIILSEVEYEDVYELPEEDNEVEITQVNTPQVQIARLAGSELSRLLLDGVQMRDVEQNIEYVTVPSDPYAQMQMASEIGDENYIV